MSTPVVGLAGTLCDPTVFDPLRAALPGVPFDAVSWMTEPGPWDVPTVAARVADRLRAAGLGPAVVIGHSTGGAVAQALALDHPAAVAGLVLVDTGPNMHEHGDVEAIVETIRTGWSEALAAGILDRSFADPLPEADRGAMLAYASRVDRQAALDVLVSQHALDFVPRLSEFDGLPVEVVHGSLDPVRTVEQSRWFAALLDAPVTVLDCGHTPPYERPAEVAEVVRRVIARVAPAAAGSRRARPGRAGNGRMGA